MILESATGVQQEIDRSHKALRASLRPLDHRTLTGQGGHFRGAFTSGLTTVLNANDRIFSVRWATHDRLLVVKRLLVAASVQTAFGTAQENAVDLVKLTGFTAGDTGGTAITLGDSCKQRSDMAGSVINDIRIASATAVAAGTAVIDGVQGRLALNLGNTLGNAAEGVLYDHKPGVDHPLVLGLREGLNIRIAVTQGATGVVRFVVTMEWAEVPIELFT